jgi:hypothetical protein
MGYHEYFVLIIAGDDPPLTAMLMGWFAAGMFANCGSGR